MLFLFITLIAIAAVLLGRLMMGRWLNHLSLYSLGFGISLAAYATGWIAYWPISAEAWIILVSGGISVFLGSAAVLLCWRATPVINATNPNYRVVKLAIILFAAAGSIAVGLQIRQTVHEFGSLFEALLNHATEVYGLRMKGSLGGEPYLLFFGYAACAPAGAYTAMKGRLTAIGLLPLFVVAVSALVSMQRTGLVMAATLLLFAFLLSPRPSGFRVSTVGRWTLGVLLAAVLMLFLVVGGQRGMYQAFQNQSATLTRLSAHWGDLPSHFVYISSPGPALSVYLEHPEIAPGGLFGSFTFQSVYRLLAKIGFQTYVPYYPPFIHTPIETNQATYLAYLFSDFGAFGVVAIPFFAGALTTWLALRLKQRLRLGDLMLYSHLMLCMTFAFTWHIIGATFFAVSLIVGTCVGMYADRRVAYQ